MDKAEARTSHAWDGRDPVLPDDASLQRVLETIRVTGAEHRRLILALAEAGTQEEAGTCEEQLRQAAAAHDEAFRQWRVATSPAGAEISGA